LQVLAESILAGKQVAGKYKLCAFFVFFRQNLFDKMFSLMVLAGNARYEHFGGK